jgi:hypothetical protein
MPLSHAERQKAYRQRQKRLKEESRIVTRDVTLSTILKLEADLTSLRDEVRASRVTIDRLTALIENTISASSRDSATMSRDAASPSPEVLPKVPPAPLPNPSPTLSLIPPLSYPSDTHPPTGGKTKTKTPPKRVAITEWRPREAERRLAFDRGRDNAWIDDQADRYRCWQPNAKHKHVNYDAGFRNWIKTADEREPKGYVNGQDKQSAAEKLFDGADRAWRAFEARQRADQPPDEPLLDLGRPPGDPPGAD